MSKNDRDKLIWVAKYLEAKRNGDEKARKQAYNKLIEIIGRPLKDKDIK